MPTEYEPCWLTRAKIECDLNGHSFGSITCGNHRVCDRCGHEEPVEVLDEEEECDEL
jgi:hypothetical protein